MTVIVGVAGEIVNANGAEVAELYKASAATEATTE